MKIKAPVNSAKGAQLLAEVGVDEVYLGVKGLKEHDMHAVTFNGRFQSAMGVATSLENFDELSEVVDFCHKNQMKVYFAANSRYLSQKLNDYYLEYVTKAVRCNVDAIIVGCIGALMLLKEVDLNVPLHASTFFHPFNKYCVDFYHEMNVKSMTLPTHLTVSEIKEIGDYITDMKYDIQLEVFAQFGCSNISGRCNLFMLPSPYKGYDLLCRALYDVTDMRTGKKTESYPFLSVGKNCSICALDSLIKCGVGSIKILGREKSTESTAFIARTYKDALEKIARGVSVEEIRQNLIDQAPWWEQAFCRGPECLYKEMDDVKYCI